MAAAPQIAFHPEAMTKTGYDIETINEFDEALLVEFQRRFGKKPTEHLKSFLDKPFVEEAKTSTWIESQAKPSCALYALAHRMVPNFE